MDRLSAPSECRVQALYCSVVADIATDEEVRTLWVSMAQTWTKLAEATERLSREGQGARMVTAQDKAKSQLEAPPTQCSSWQQVH
jgi:alpha-ketoglutarate-dependent taurine dioxygenase